MASFSGAWGLVDASELELKRTISTIRAITAKNRLETIANIPDVVLLEAVRTKVSIA